MNESWSQPFCNILKHFLKHRLERKALIQHDTQACKENLKMVKMWLSSTKSFHEKFYMEELEPEMLLAVITHVKQVVKNIAIKAKRESGNSVF